MRKVIVGAFVSLDGVMQAPGGPEEDQSGGFAFGGWTFPYWDEASGKAMDETFSRSFDLLLGRKTYDIFAAFWPHHPDEIGTLFNRVVKYVATHRPESLEWANSHALSEDVMEGVRALKASGGPDLLTQGSADFVQQLLAADLIDELRLLTYPVLLGKGKRLWSETAHPGAFRLTGSQTTSTGVVIAQYERAGEIKTGSFA